MASQVGSEEKGNPDDRPGLLKNFRDVLADRYPQRIGMERILSDSGLLNPGPFIIETPEAIDRWYYALSKMDSQQLLNLITVVRDDGPDHAVEALWDFEQARLEKAETERHAEARAAFAGLIKGVEAIAEGLKKLRIPAHLNPDDLRIIEDQLDRIYQSLDNLRGLQVQQPKVIRDNETTKADGIERQANPCVDALQLYRFLIAAREADETSRFGVTNPAGGLAGQANDERALVRAKAELRNSLIRLVRAGQSG